jgi:uncharacterized protein YggE
MDKTSSYIIAIAVLGIILVSSLYAVNPALGDKRTLDVTGTAEMKTIPDRAYVYASVETSASSAQEAQQKNSEKMNAIMAALSDYTVETVSYSIEPVYNYSDEKPYYIQQISIIGYRALNSIKVTLTDITKAGDVADLVISSGANKIDSVQFDLSTAKEKELRNQIYYNASMNARQKADAIAGGLGVRIADPSKITESYYNYRPYYAPAKMLDAAGSSAETIIIPGTLDVSASISVTYEIT